MTTFFHWFASGVGIRRQQDINTAVVSNIFDAKGEVVAGVASVEAIVSFPLLFHVSSVNSICCQL